MPNTHARAVVAFRCFIGQLVREDIVRGAISSPIGANELPTRS